MDVKRLKSIPLLAGVPDDELAVMSAFASEREVSPGESLIREGEFAYDLIFIQSGQAEVLEGQTRVGCVATGDFVGEFGVMKDALRTASVVATEPMRVVAVSSWDVKRIVANPAVKARLESSMAARGLDR